MSQPIAQKTYQDEYKINYAATLPGQNNHLPYPSFSEQNYPPYEERFFILLKRHWHDLLDLDTWKILFSVLRFILNSSFSFLVFYQISKLPILPSLMASVLIGGSSALIQFFNENYTKWIGRGNLRVQIFKWYLVEIVFLLIPYLLVFMPFAIKLHGKNWGMEGLSLLWAALLSMLSQGVWELAIVYRKKQKFGVNSENMNRLKVIFKFRFLVVSCFSVFCAVLNLVNPILGGMAFAFYAMSGFIYCGYLWLDYRLRMLSKSIVNS